MLRDERGFEVKKLCMQLTLGGDDQPSASHANGVDASEDRDDDADADVAGPRSTASFLERSCFIPLRLSADERRLLHLLEAALSVSAYTDKASLLTRSDPVCIVCSSLPCKGLVS